MTERNETHVLYKALADFSALHKKVRDARRDLKKLQADESAYNRRQRALDKAAKAAANSTQNKASKVKKKELAEEAKAVDNVTKSVYEHAKATAQSVNETKKATGAAKQWASAFGAAGYEVKKQNQNIVAWAKALGAADKEVRQLAARQAMLARGFGGTNAAGNRFSATIRKIIADMRGGNSAANTFGTGVLRLERGLTRLSRWRPRLIPPFVALIPIIAAVIAAINPLIAILGAAGGAVIGFGNALSSLASIAVALPGLFSAIAAGITGVIVSMRGIGGVFKAYSALKNATGGGGGGGGGRSQEERADALAAAEDRVRRAQRGVTKAQEDLNEARQQALKDLVALRLEVSRASLNEERALANLQLAKENYNNVLADPGSTKGDKLDAAAAVKEAEADLEDVRRQNKENREALAEAEKKGIENSDEVVAAKERIIDSERELREAQRALRKEQLGLNDATGAAATAQSEYQKALDKLSPSARKFVLGLIAMQDKLEALRRNVQESFFSKIVDDLDDIEGFLPTIENLLSKAAGAMGDFFHNLIQMVTSDAWKADLDFLADSNVKIIENLGDAILFVLDALRNVAVAAAPFTESLTESIRGAAESFKELTEAGRNNGTLAEWLEKSQQRLSQWWRIIKNIAGAIFNYSQAAGDFADWLMNGLEETTDGWLKASEAANAPDSSFKKWLENIKPLLSEIKGVFSDIWDWFKTEASDPENIREAVDLLRTIRDDLGPAVGRFLDTLAATDIDEQFVQAFTSIVESIDSILEKGGSAGFETFFDVVTGFFSALADLVAALPPDSLDLLLRLFGAIAALALIRNFPGVGLLFRGFAALATKTGFWGKFFGGWKSLNKMGFKGLLAVLGKLGLIGLVAGTVAGQVSNAADTLSTPVARQNAGEYEDIAREKGAPTAIKEINSDFSKDGNALKATSPILGIISETLGLFSEDMKAGFDQWLEDTSTGFLNWVSVDLPAQFGNGWTQIQTWWSDLIGSFANGWTQITTWWNDVLTAFGNGWTQIETWWNDLMISFGNGWDQIVAWWNTYVIIPLANGWNQIVTWWNGLINSFGNGWRQITIWWDGVIKSFGRGWEQISTWWSNVTRDAGKIWSNISTWWNNLINDIGRWFSSLPQAIVDTIGGALSGLGGWITSLFGNRGGAVPGGANSESNRTFPTRGVPRYAAKGGAIYLANGGKTLRKFEGTGMRPIGTDTVPAMLTPGEFVLRKSIVDAIGVENLEMLNAGAMSLVDMLSRASVSQKRSQATISRTNYFSGGGLAGSTPSIARVGSSVPVPVTQRSSTTNVNGGVTIEKLEVNNPVPETASQSLTRTVRNVTRYGVTRGGTKV